MRHLRLSILTLGLLLGACSGSDLPESSASGTGTDSDTDTSSGSASASSTTATSNSGTSTTTGASGTDSNSNSGTGGLCTPGETVSCACPDGTTSTQACAPDGASFEPCDCAGTSMSASGTTTGDPTTTTDPSTTTTGDPTTTTDGTTTTGGVVCEDPGPEPNDEQADSTDVGDQACNAGPESVMGVLNGDADADWYTYAGDWTCGQGDPNLVTTVTADENVRLCVYVECNQGDTDFNCPNNTQDAEAPDGQLGCCGMGMVSFTLNCAGTGDESAQVWISVDQAPPDSCVAYTIDYDYHQP